jgi:uncharacterized protein involved in outer membrane biogenesis
MNPAAAPRQRRAARIAAGLAVAAGIWALAWFGVPPLVKAQLEEHGSQALGRELRVQQVELTPRKLALTLHGLSIAAAPGSADAEPLLRIERLHLDLHMRSWWRLAPVLEAVEVDAPRLRVARVEPGRYDIDDLIRRLSAPAELPASNEPVRFALFNLQLRNGEVRFDDQPVGSTHHVSDIRLDLPFLSSLPDQLDTVVEPRLAFIVDGSAVDIGGSSRPFSAGRPSTLNLRFGGLKLDPWWAYWPDELPLRPQGGVLGVELSLDFEHREASRLLVRGRVDLDDLALQDAQQRPFARWDRLVLQLGEVRPLQRQAALDALRIDGLQLELQRDSGGRWNLPRPAEAASQASATTHADVSLKRLELHDARIDFDDATLSPRAPRSLAAIEPC